MSGVEPAPRAASCSVCDLPITWERRRGVWLAASGRSTCDARPDRGQHSPASS